jgi:hypothetical protein
MIEGMSINRGGGTKKKCHEYCGRTGIRGVHPTGRNHTTRQGSKSSQNRKSQRSGFRLLIGAWLPVVERTVIKQPENYNWKHASAGS